MVGNVSPEAPMPGSDAPDDNPFLKEQQRVTRGGRLHWIHWLIVGASALLTVVAWYVVQTQVDERIRNQFEREAQQVVELVSERMEKYEDALWGGVAAIQSQSRGIDYVEWKRFSETLQIEKKYPGINGIGVIYRKRPEEIAAFLAEQRKGRPGFKIHPPHQEKEFFPITFIEPADLNAAAIGLDMAHESNRYTAARKARDTGKPQITGPIVLVQDAAKTPGFLFYAPFYVGGLQDSTADRRENFVGMVYAPFIFKKLMAGALDKDRRHVGIKIVDNDEVLYDENRPEEKDFDPEPLFRKALTVDMYGRAWNLQVLSARSFRQAASTNKPWLILLGGAVIDSLLLGLFISLARANRRAVRYAERMTQEFQSKTNRLSNVIEHAVDGLMTIDQKGMVEIYNPACERIFGYSAEEVIGQNIKMLMPEPYHSNHDSYLRNYHTTGNKRIIGIGRTVEGKRKDGTVFPLDLSVSEIFVEGRRLYSGIVRDISERTRAEDEIMRSNLELERFAYIASHDLQEPLRMVSSFTELLHEEYGDKVDDQAREYMDFTLDASRRMQTLVSDLLEYSRVDSDESGFSSFDAKTLIKVAVDNLQDAIDETQATVTVGGMPTVFANPVRFTRLIQNLTGNAIKYRAHDRPVEVAISAAEQENDWLFAVRDNGIGIKQEYLEQIFIIFKRLHNKDEYPGTGIGLAICAKIVENFGGRIWVDSEEGKGSVFYFTLPKQNKMRNVA